MNKLKFGVVALVIALALSSFGIALADSHEDPPPSEEEGFTHPVAELLAEYFGSVSEEDQDAAKEALGTEENPVDHVEFDAETGIYTVFYADGSSVEIDGSLADPDTLAALDTLVQAETGVATLYDEIEEYHASGLGFGVIVKFLAMSDSGEVSMEELVAAFEGGQGVGQLFKEYGKPEILGVGHVRQALKDGEYDPSAFSPGNSNNGNHGGGNDGEHGPPDHSHAGGNGGGGENGPPDHANNDKDKDD